MSVGELYVVDYLFGCCVVVCVGVDCWCVDGFCVEFCLCFVCY